MTTKLSETVLSFLETEVFELADAPDAFGLTDEERDFYGKINAMVNRDKRTITVTTRDQISALIDLCNMADAIAEEPIVDHEDRIFARRACKSLCTIQVNASRAMSANN